MPRRTGFTLFQLLVVLAVLLILLALLLPAIQKVRLAAARMTSQNNLKQIALAVHSHADAMNAFPAGCNDPHFSALAHLLPYVEQANVYRLIDFTRDADDRANAQPAGLRLPVLLSPLDPLPPTA